MGAALPAIGSAIATFFTSSAVVYVVARTVLINLALGAITKSLTRRRESAPPPLNVSIRGTVERRRIVLGTRRVGGVIVFYGTSDTSNAVLWYVIVYTGHQVSAITDVWLDNVRIANADINGSGLVTAGQFANQVSIFKHLGAGAQTVDINVDGAFSEWTSNHRLRGCAYAVVKMNRSDSAFPNGAPQSVSVLMDGAFLYDPRLDSTNGGSGTHRRTDPQTWAFSGGVGRNPALQARWYISGGSVVNDQASRLIMYGLKESDSRILDAYTIAAANECDENITGLNAPPSGAQLRYRGDLEISCGESRRDILESILATMAGVAINEKGTWRIYAGAYDTPAHSFTQDDLYGDLEIQDTTPHEARYNAVGATFIDAAKQYVEQTTILWTDSTYETQDGGERIQRIIDLRGVTDQYQAQRLALIEHKKSRMMRTAKIHGAVNLLKVGKWETINLSHSRYSWSSRIFRTMARQFEFNQEAGRVVLSVQREDPAVYADPLTSDYTTGATATDSFTTDGPDAPTTLTIERFREQLLLSWTLPPFRGPTLWTEIWEYTAQTPFASASKIYETQSNVALIKNYFPTEPRYYWIRFRNAAGQVSATFPATNGQQVQPLRGLEEEFFDGFEHQDYARFYNLRAGAPTITYPANGENGGHVIRFQDYGWVAWKDNIPFDPNSLYCMTVRARMTTAPTGGVSAEDHFFAGVEGVAADGTTLINTSGSNSSSGQHYFCAANFDFGSVSLGDWTTFRGYLEGLGTPDGVEHPDITDPQVMYSSGGTVTKFIRPLIITNFNGGNGTMEVDYIRLDRVKREEDIGPNAATEVRLQTTAGPISDFGTNVTNSADTMSFTVDFAGQLVVTFSYDAQQTGGAGLLQAAVKVWDTSVGGSLLGQGNGAIIDTANRSYISRAIVDVPADTAVVVDFSVKHALGSSTGSFSNIQYETEFIKK